jgi:hypothetical protein
MTSLITGAIVMACVTIGLVFLRFWKSSGDRFFIYFALSFWIQGAQWLHSGTLGASSEYSPLYYLARLAAYALIVFAILNKNFGRNAPRNSAPDQ